MIMTVAIMLHNYVGKVINNNNLLSQDYRATSVGIPWPDNGMSQEVFICLTEQCNQCSYTGTFMAMHST